MIKSLIAPGGTSSGPGALPNSSFRFAFSALSIVAIISSLLSHRQFTSLPTCVGNTDQTAFFKMSDANLLEHFLSLIM